MLMTTVSIVIGASSSIRLSLDSSRQASGSSDNSARSALFPPNVQDYTHDTAYLSPEEPQSRTNDLRTSLDLLHSHRLSHVAETGQLAPRVRRDQPRNSGDWAHSVLRAAKIESFDYFAPRRPSPSPPSSPLLNPFSTPSRSVTTSTEPTTPTSYISSASTKNQGPPLLQIYEPETPQSNAAQRHTAPSELAQVKETVPQLDVSHPPPSFQPQRNSQVLRKVNSGFEILRPGTLDNVLPPQPGPESGIDGTRRASKRLQKKRRTSSSSEHRISSFIEQV